MPALLEQSDTILELNAIPTDTIVTKTIEAFSTLPTSIKKITIACNTLTAMQAKEIVDVIKSDKSITATINLPLHLHDTVEQISLDNLVSNNRLEQYKQTLSAEPSLTPINAAAKIEQRVLPKKVKPKIEITLSEPYIVEPVILPKTTHNESLSILDSELIPLERSPMAEVVVTAIVSQPGQESNRKRWEGIVKGASRLEALDFRQKLADQFTLATHPLPQLIKSNKDLSKHLDHWGKSLHFEKVQLDALLDVYGQAGEAGLGKLFAIWNAYNADEYQSPAFFETYTHLLKYMPTYLPFIDDSECQDTIRKIATLSKDHRSLWMALIQNHGQTAGYSHLPTLFKQFMQAVNAIEAMGLSFYEIKEIQDKKDLPTTLKNILHLLNQCHKEDRTIQWRCINRITLPSKSIYHFITPEMQKDLSESSDIEIIKGFLEKNKDTDPQEVIPLFYRYLARQEQHLPLETYQNIIEELLNHKDLNNEIKIRLIYVLAKTTSTQEPAGFEPCVVLKEWERFKNGIITLEPLERLKANRSDWLKKRFTDEIDKRGGNPAVRIKTITPIMEMPVTPPMSYLNKLFILSEYKFLDPGLYIWQLERTQKTMMKAMNAAALLYKDYPAEMIHAIRLIKTETPTPNKAGHYIAQPEDIGLLEKFVAASTTLLAKAVNPPTTPDLNPKNVLLPLLTVFHLEYESPECLNNQVIKPYQQRISSRLNEPHKEKIERLLPYGLSLFQLTQQRDNPSRLNYKILNEIQEGLMDLICRPRLITKQEIRNWLHERYGTYFPNNLLLNIKEPVDFSEQFKELNCHDNQTCRDIEHIVSNFNNPDEKDQHSALVKSLVSLTHVLTESQKTEFFEVCRELIKAGELLSREKHQGPPSYLTQFTVLIESIIKNNAYNEFRQYISVQTDFQGEICDNSLAKCTYLLNILYPTLLKEGLTKQDAFIFATQIISINSLQALEKRHEPPTPPRDGILQWITRPLSWITRPLSWITSFWEAVQQERAGHFDIIAVHLYQKQTLLINKYQNIGKRAADFIRQAWRLSDSNIKKNYLNISTLVDSLIELNDQNIVLSLMYHYAGGLRGNNVQNLIDLFEHVQYKELPKELKKDFIQAIVSQMNNSIVLTKDEVYQFLHFIHQHKNDEQCKHYLHKYYLHAPFPRLDSFTDWFRDKASIESNYAQFDKNPCATKTHNGRESENGFHIKKAAAIISKIPEVRSLFTPKYLQSIADTQKRVRDLTTQEILDQFKEFKNTPPSDHVYRVMLLAEFLHRCKGRLPEYIGTTPVLGRSYELNTTQIIAILSLLKLGKKVTAEICTGEGKSWIMMILIAYQFLIGNTADFLTSNLSLAERDYLEFLTFFKSLGAEVNIITSSSKIEDYRIGGVNFSDPENIGLFRARANKVLAPPRKRAALIDEGDVLCLDLANLEYNYSSKIKNGDLVPLFPLLMDFFAQSDTEKTYLENKQRCTQQLQAFIENRNPSLFALIKSMPISKLEQLQDAAYIARHLEYNVDYTIVPDARIPGALGERIVAAAMCLINSRISKNANFSDGVHQCLHAELNRLMKADRATPIDPYLHEALEQCKNKGRTFIVSPQKETTYTSSAHTLLKTYHEGSMHVVTGTIGLHAEQQEAMSIYGTQFITIPRHKGMHRIDRPPLITADAGKQLDALLNHILESYAKNQPILLVCKNDSESEKMYKALQDRLLRQCRKENMPKLTRIHAGFDYEKESHYIKTEAGAPGHVTITTAMEGRGVDIVLQKQARAVGLKVLLTYLPDGERDYKQILGRTARYGAKGETQLVLNLCSLKEDFGIDKLDTDFYLNPEEFIRKLQMFATLTKELQRLFHRVYDNFLTQFAEAHAKLHTTDFDLTEVWVEFLAEYKKTKDTSFNAIIAELEQNPPNIKKINEQLLQHNNTTQQLWNTFIEKLPVAKQEVAKKLNITLQKPKMLEQWLVEMESVKDGFTDVKDTLHVRVKNRYDPTAAGSMQLSKEQGVLRPFINDFLAWWRGKGILFPNVRAWLAGQLSFKNLLSHLPFFRLFIKPVEEKHTIIRRVPSAHAPFYSSEGKISNFYRDHPLIGSSVQSTDLPEPTVTVHQAASINEPVILSTGKESALNMDDDALYVDRGSSFAV